MPIPDYSFYIRWKYIKEAIEKANQENNEDGSQYSGEFGSPPLDDDTACLVDMYYGKRVSGI